MRCGTVGTVLLAVVFAISSGAWANDQTSIGLEVAAVERSFAQTMVDRDHEAFVSFLSDEAVFISGPMALRGKQAVAEQWLLYFQGPQAPFSWEPETVEVLESGTLALSTGPVRNADGSLLATFTSIWRQEEPGVWRIVFDKGNRACPPPAPAAEDAPVTAPESAVPDAPEAPASPTPADAPENPEGSNPASG